MRCAIRFGLICGLAWVIPSAAWAQTSPPSGVVSLTASASVEVDKDLMSVTLAAVREGPDANAVQTALKQGLDAALEQARRVAKPGAVDVRTGNFSLYPRYTPKGQMSGWQGRAELLIEGRDMKAVAALAGRIDTMAISHVGYGLSRELREKSEVDVTGQAIARYRTNAAAIARGFGYGGFTLREVNVSASEPPGGIVPMMRMQAKAAPVDDSPLPVEAGKAIVSVSVSGTVQLDKPAP